MLFDPYYRWLGIPKHSRPPTHYQILGLTAGESDPDVIDEAAIRQTTHLRTYQLGEHAAACTKLLNEIALAKTTLLHPAKKQAYDREMAPQPTAETATNITAKAPARSAFLDDDESEAPVMVRRGPIRRQPPVLLYGMIAGGVALLVVAGIVTALLLHNRTAVPVVAGADKKAVKQGKAAEKNNAFDKKQPEVPAVVHVVPKEQAVEPPKDADKKPPEKKGGGFNFTILLNQQNCQDLAWNQEHSVVAAATTPVRLLDGRTHQILDTVVDPRNGLTNVRRVVFSRDGAKLAIGCGNYGGIVGIYDIAAKNVRTMTAPLNSKTGNGVLGMAISNDGRRLVTTHAKGRIHVFDGVTGDLERTLDAEATQQAARFLSNGRTLVTGGDDGKLRLWNAETGALEKQYDIPPVGSETGMFCLDVSADDRLVLFGQGKHFRRFDLQTQTPHKSALAHEELVAGVAISADGNYLGSVDRAGHFTLINERAFFTYRGQMHLTKVHSLGFGADNRSVWFAGQQGLAPLTFASINFPGDAKK